MTSTLQKLVLLALFVLLGVVLLYPNSFGNNPDEILDESYFLTSSLASIEKAVPPGWEFSPSGAYYGGVQTYVDTIALVPVIGGVFVREHFSLTATKLWVALNTGELLHVLRLVSGLSALAAIAWCFFFFRRRRVPRLLRDTLLLFLFLLLSNVLVIEFLHTAKVWSYYIILVAIVSAFFIAQEYYARYQNEPLLTRSTYTALLLWSATLAFFQSFVGAFSILVFLTYALLLKHINLRDVWGYIRRFWYLFVIAGTTQISFIYRAYTMRAQFAGVSTTTASGAVDWFDRFYRPLVFALLGQPLSLLYPLALIALTVIFLRQRTFFADKRRSLSVVLVALYPVLMYAFFYLVVGFDLLPRYGILLTLACAFAAAILLSELGARAVQGAFVLSVALLAVIAVHAVPLYWHPSSESTLLSIIETKYNTPNEVFITDHSARRLTLPTNYASLAYLDEQRVDMSRFQFLLDNRQLLASDTTFRPITMTAYLDAELAGDIARFATTTDAVWVVSADCAKLCSAKEARTGTCFEINTNSCGVQSQEVNTLPVFLAADQLGYSYIVRRVH